MAVNESLVNELSGELDNDPEELFIPGNSRADFEDIGRGGFKERDDDCVAFEEISASARL